MLVTGSGRSPFRNFVSLPRIVVGWDEDDTQRILKQSESNVNTYEKPIGIYSITQRLFTPWEVMKGLCKLNMMILA